MWFVFLCVNIFDADSLQFRAVDVYGYAVRDHGTGLSRAEVLLSARPNCQWAEVRFVRSDML